MKTTIRKDLVKILTKHNIPLKQIQAAELHWQDRKGYFPTEYQKIHQPRYHHMQVQIM